MNTDITTLRDFLMRYNVLTEACFGSCVSDLTTRSVSGDEELCTKKCFDKMLNMTQRLSLKFQDHMMAKHATSSVPTVEQPIESTPLIVNPVDPVESVDK